jgi:A/G-specific adenine glycosylase
LAAAPIARVLRLWSGLGYYRRAENLHRAARQIVRHHHGHLPDEFAALRRLPGIGDYTAGAILSIAFKQPYAAIDGNVRRVFGRLFGATADKELRHCAAQLLHEANPGDLNQALMELGATICTPRLPSCSICPVARQCPARNRQLNAPAQAVAAKPFRQVSWPLAIVERRGKVLLRRRSDDGLLAKLWELPGCEIAGAANPLASLRRELRAHGIRTRPPSRLGEFRHSITDRRIRAAVFLFNLTTPPVLPKNNYRWVDARKFHQPVSAMTAKAIELYLDHEAPTAQ